MVHLLAQIFYPDVSPTVLYTVIVPITDNGGQPLAPRHLRWTERTITHHLGGLTRFSPGVGYWVGSSGKPKRDAIVPIQVVAPTGPGTEAWLLNLAAELAQCLQQEEIFLFGQGVQLVDTTSLAINGAKANGARK